MPPAVKYVFPVHHRNGKTVFNCLVLHESLLLFGLDESAFVM